MIFALLALLWSFASAAQQLVPVPPLSGPVVDTTGTLPPDQLQGLTARLEAFAKTKGAQVQVLIVPTTQPEDITQYGIRVADAWKIGRAKVDDGVILIVARDDRRLRIEVGYGLEGAIPDARANQIINQIITPRFRSGDMSGGIEDGVDAILKLVNGEELPPPPIDAQMAETSLPGIMPAIFIGFIAGLIGSAIFGRGFGTAGGSALGGFLGFTITGLVTGGFMAALVTAIAILFLRGGGGGWHSGGGGMGGGWHGGGFGGGGGGGWSGGGGGFGGGGASGSW
jgi:uncharacterized protein